MANEEQITRNRTHLQRCFYDAFDDVLNDFSLGRYLDKRASLPLSVLPPGRMLDVGCGQGLIGKRFAQLGFTATGLDLSWKRLRKAEAYHPAGLFVAGMAENMPFQSESFNLTFANALLHHVSCVAAVLDEMIRVTKKGGNIALVEPNRMNPLIIAQAGLRRVEWNLFKIARTDVIALLKGDSRVKSLREGRFNELFYPYRSIPGKRSAPVFSALEKLLEKISFCTHFYIVCERI